MCKGEENKRQKILPFFLTPTGPAVCLAPIGLASFFNQLADNGHFRALLGLAIYLQLMLPSSRTTGTVFHGFIGPAIYSPLLKNWLTLLCNKPSSLLPYS